MTETEEQLERKATIATRFWMVGGVLVCVVAYLTDVNWWIVAPLFLLWWASVVPLMHYFPDDLMRTRQRHGF
ncbi:hypothetical protein LCGC14_2164240 [marine sediment metagenome]|uniref:2TM domain-containing protein n=1 Tax=marine sediment metagenome TaxID=412755 RepID=A0A0F9DRS1_9ZZZZ